jgi:hypothetical protein
MSFSESNNNFIDDELFLADCASSRIEKNSSGTVYSTSFMQRSIKHSSSGNLLAYHMLKALLLRLLYGRAKNIQRIKFKRFTAWRFMKSECDEYSPEETKVYNMIANIKTALRRSVKKYFAAWARNSKFLAIDSKYLLRKSRKEETHISQLAQIHKALSQLQNKSNETEKNIDQLATKEKKYKEVLENIAKSQIFNNSEINKYLETLRKLELENENLKDKLEAVENNVTGFIKDMSGVLENDEDIFTDDDGRQDFQLKSTRKKKLSIVN